MAIFFGKKNPLEPVNAPFAPPENIGNAPKLPGADAAALASQKIIGREEVRKAAETLRKYKEGKAALEDRIIQDEEWYRLRHWEYLRKKKDPKNTAPEPTSAWLFNSLCNKHADAMDNFPVPAVLPREQSDQENARILSEVLPVVLERADFEQTYSDNWWEKLKHGTPIYGIFWDQELENGLGDIAIRKIDALNVFWEPGVEDVQDGKNFFIVSLVDKEDIASEYPNAAGSLDGGAITVSEYIHDESIDQSDKTLVVDWYYKRKSPDGRTILHYCKFVGDEPLYATENDPELRETGLYDHGMYPVVLDPMFPEKDTPAGFGYVTIAKDPQMYIDKLSGAILENALMCAKPRFFRSAQTGVNIDQFCDWQQSIVDVEGNSLDDTRLRQIDVQQVPGNVLDVLQMKINELKDTTSNRDYNSGGTTSGVTAAAAIAALQEAGNKTSRDAISASYRAYRKISAMCVELMRQFYDQARVFRIVAPNGAMEFVQFSNSGLKDQVQAPAVPGAELSPDYVPMFRRPIFDIDIKAQKKSPFSQMAQNEIAKELYSMGFFNPQLAQQSLAALQIMEFDGKDQVTQSIQQGQTLLNLLQQVTMERDMLAARLGILPADSQKAGVASPSPASGGSGIGAAAKNAQTETMTPYGQQVAERSKPDMSKSAGTSV